MTTSPDGTTITDVTNTLWLIDHGTMYVNKAGAWQKWTGVALVPASDPRIVVSPDRTVSKSGQAPVIDALGQQWTCDAGGSVYVNSVRETQSTAVSALGIFGGIIHQNSAGGVYKWGQANKTWTKVSDPGFGTGVAPPLPPSGALVYTLAVDRNNYLNANNCVYIHKPGVGPYRVHSDPWGVADFSWAFSIKHQLYDTFPRGTVISWNFPSGLSGGVKAYPNVGWRGGDYWAANICGPISNNFVAGVRLDQITRCVVTFDITNAGDAMHYGTGFDFCLTPSPSYNSGRTAQAFEILVALRYGEGKAGGVVYTTPADPYGVKWQIVVQDVGSNAPIEVVIQPETGWLLKGRIDFMWLFQAIAASGKVFAHGNPFTMAGLYFSDLRIGVEVKEGAGSATFNNLNIDYADQTGTNNYVG